MKTTGEVTDSKTGEMLTTAVGPVERIRWLEQVAGDARLGDADKSFAIALQSFVNRVEGFAYCGEKALAEKTRVAERTARLRLATLIGLGYVFRKRRGRKPAALFLIVSDRQDACRSNDQLDRQDASRSKRSVRVTRSATFQQSDRQESGRSTGKPHFSNDAKSDSCEPITQREPRDITQGSAAASAARPQARAAASSQVRERAESEYAASDGSSLTHSLAGTESRDYPQIGATEALKKKRHRIDYRAILARLDSESTH